MPAPEEIALEALRDSLAWFPLEAATGGNVRLVALDEAANRAASFLDQRLLQHAHARTTIAGAWLETAAAGLAPCARYLFHTGHVGSTLLSRLIGAHAGFFSLREPALLRVLAEAPQAAALSLPVTLALLGRRWRAGQHVVVKATSFVSEIADPILAAS